MRNKIITMMSLCIFASVSASSSNADCCSLEEEMNKFFDLLYPGMLSASSCNLRADLFPTIALFLEYGANTNALDVTCRTAHKALEHEHAKIKEIKEALKPIKERFATNPNLMKMTKSLRALPLSDEIKTWFVQKVINPSELAQIAFIKSLPDKNVEVDSEEENVHWICARLNNPEWIKHFSYKVHFIGHSILTLPTSKQKYDFFGKFSNLPVINSYYIAEVLTQYPALLQELRSYTPDDPNEQVYEVDRAINDVIMSIRERERRRHPVGHVILWKQE